MLSEDPDLLEDLKKLKRQTKNAQVSAQNSLAKITLLKAEEQDVGSSKLNLVDSGQERATKSIGEAITNAQMQNYYKVFSKKRSVNNPALFMNSNPFSNYSPLPDQNILNMLKQSTPHQHQRDSSMSSMGVQS